MANAGPEQHTILVTGRRAGAVAKEKARRAFSSPLSIYSAPGGLRQGPAPGAESSLDAAACENG